MDEDFIALSKTVEEMANELTDATNQFKQEMLDKIEAAKNSRILNSLSSITARLTEIEAKLNSEEGE